MSRPQSLLAAFKDCQHSKAWKE